MTYRKLIAAGAFAALPLALAGCSGSSTPAGTGTPAAMATPSRPAGTARQLTGTQLAGALLSASDLPAGFAVDPGSATDSGGSLTAAATKHPPMSLSCSDLLDDLGKTGFGESAMAGDTAADPNTKEIFNQVVYQFASASKANEFFTSLQAKWNSCGTFTVADSGTSGKETVTAASAPAGLGDMAFENTMTASGSGMNLSGTDLAVLKATDVYIVGPGKIGGGRPADLSAQTLMTKLIASVEAAH